MIGRAVGTAMILSAVFLSVVFSSPSSAAQAPGKVITVNVEAADVYKSPSTGAPIIGHATRGTVLEITRELGSWVKVSWPPSQDGVGYVHVTMGSVGPPVPPTAPGSGRAMVQAPAPPPVRPVAGSPGQAPDGAGAPSGIPVRRPEPTTAGYVLLPSHTFGVGGRVGGPTLGFGASARAWTGSRFGVQVDASRFSLTSADAGGSVTSLQLEPSVLYSLPDVVTDNLWLRPYIGTGINLRRETLNSTSPITSSASENNLGFQVFGGSEFTVPSVAHVAISADLVYRRAQTSFTGIDFGGFGVSVSGHWYVK